MNEQKTEWELECEKRGLCKYCAPDAFEDKEGGYIEPCFENAIHTEETHYMELGTLGRLEIISYISHKNKLHIAIGHQKYCHEDDFFGYDAEIKYCPMCGRKLEGDDV